MDRISALAGQTMDAAVSGAKGVQSARDRRSLTCYIGNATLGTLELWNHGDANEIQHSIRIS